MNDKIFIEPAEKIRLIIQQEIGLSRVLDAIASQFKVEIFKEEKQIVLLVEEKTDLENKINL